MSLGSPGVGVVLGEYAAGEQSLTVAGEIVAVAQLDDHRAGEWLVGAGPVAGGVELVGGFGRCAVRVARG
jgi:hypothetical protein